MKLDLSINKGSYENDFQCIAKDLMNNWVLKVQSAQYRIAEIEFYMKSDFHSDDYTHGHPMQKSKGKWYFHGSGIDLTFGSDEYYGGILLRAIYNLGSRKYIYGPLNCVCEIFSNFESVYETEIVFGLKPASKGQLPLENPIKAPRIGLNPNKNTGMYEKLYRFLIMPKFKHAEKTKIAKAMEQQGLSESEIASIWG